MGDNLTQEQIEAMIKAADGGSGADETPPAYMPTIDDLDILGEVYNMSMGNAATAASGLIRMKVDITTPIVDVVKKSDLVYKSLEPAVAVEIKYLEGVKGVNTFILSQHDIMIIVNIMMGGDGQLTEAEEFTELHVSAVAEMMNQMMGSASKALSDFLQTKIDITPPNAYTLDGDYAINTEEDYDKDTMIVMAKFKFIVGDVINSEMILTASMEFTKDLLDKAKKGYGMIADEMVVQPVDEQIAEMAHSSAGAMSQKQIEEMLKSADAQTANTGASQQREPTPEPPPQRQSQQPPPRQQARPQNNRQTEPVNVQEVQYSSFDTPEDELYPYDANFDMVLDLPLNVTVEIGRTKYLVQDVLDLGEGSIIELDKQVAEPVDVLVNGNLVAKGNVVVINEIFAVRVTEIISPQEKIKIAKNEL